VAELLQNSIHATAAAKVVAQHQDEILDFLAKP